MTCSSRWLRLVKTLSVFAVIAADVRLAPAWSQVLTLHVDADTTYEIDGTDQVPHGIFGVSAYEGAPYLADSRYREVMEASGVTTLGFSAGTAVPPDVYNLAFDQIEDWLASDQAVAQETNGNIHGSKYLYGQILPACRRLGIEPMMFIWGTDDPKTFAPRDNKLFAVVAANYVALLKRFDPQLRLVQLYSEPNAVWRGKGGKQYAEMFKLAAAAIKAKTPDVLVGGPANCWPPSWPQSQLHHKNWHQWDSWTLPLITMAGDELDFFAYHDYHHDPAIAAEEIGLIVNAMLIHTGKRLPVAITEAGRYMSWDQVNDPKTHYRIRTLGYQRMFLTYLERPASVLAVLMHDLSADVGGAHRFLKYDYFGTRRPDDGPVTVGPIEDLVKIAGGDRPAEILLWPNTSPDRPPATEMRINIQREPVVGDWEERK